ncbi:hypothetical protein [Chryseobacterium indologenes]|uniref:hypothetical protein n=1 Tax=Chryseobacterium indologenes TaxID=253 RepID=UPI0009A24C93|nr:hypothetical protein [Chryseobacterium indologenes]
MSHQEKQEIFDRYAKEKYKDNFEEFILNTLYEVRDNEISNLTAVSQIRDLVFAACDLVQEEQQKRIAENAKMLLHDGFHKSNKQTKYYQIGADNLQIDKSSIINPENLIK